MSSRRTMVAVLTIVHGRHDHLAELLAGCDRSDRRPDLVVVAAMDDPTIETQVRHNPLRTVVLHVDRHPLGLPLAAARNAAADAALGCGADVLIFLDVDCIPSPSLIARYAEVVTTRKQPRPWVAAGEVAYLPPSSRGYRPDELDELAEPHPSRPVLDPGRVEPADELDLFWSLSFATSARSWRSLGGFHPDYIGYGGEDTDFAMRIGQSGGELVWVGGARAYHQHHDSQNPPVQHLADIVRNSRIFHSRWGRWPMRGWLEEFDRRGLIRFDGERLTVPQ